MNTSAEVERASVPPGEMRLAARGVSAAMGQDRFIKRLAIVAGVPLEALVVNAQEHGEEEHHELSVSTKIPGFKSGTSQELVGKLLEQYCD